MKTFKCPLCGRSFELFEEGRSSYLYQCMGCPLASEVSYTEDGALKNATKLISMFPPYMRVHEGDKVKLEDYGEQIFTIESRDVANSKLYFKKTEIGFPDSAYGREVSKWPWELEQEGGQNDC